MTKKQLEKDYTQFISDYINAGKPILNRDGEILNIKDDEVFLQCYADVPTRKTFYKFWFISNYDNLISAWNDKVKWIKPHERKNGTKCYKYKIKTNDETRIKTIETHNLVGLVFGSEAYGKANGHHKDGNHTNNTPDNIQFTSTPVHILLDKIPPHNATNEEVFKFMIDLSKLAEQEEPNKVTILFDGDTYNKETGEYVGNDGNVSIHALNSITLSREALMQVLGVMYE